MDTSSIAIGLALIFLFVGPIMYMALYQSNKNKKQLQSLKTLGSQNNMNLDEFELSNSIMLGIDSTSKKLIIVETKNNKVDVIDLKKIKASTVSKKGLPPANGNKTGLQITHISLALQKNTKEAVTEITFYDEDDETSYDAETQLTLANKWDNLIKRNLSA